MSVEMKIHIEGAKELQRYLRQIKKNVGDLRPYFKVAGLLILESVQKNFQEGGRPKWTPLSPATIRRRRGSGTPEPLRDTGVLMTSVGSEGARYNVLQVAKGKLLVGTNRPGAAAHQFGATGAKTNTIVVPARPFMMLQPADEEKLVRIAGDMAMEEKA